MEWVILLVVAYVIWKGIALSNKTKREKREAHMRYLNSLDALKADPTDADLKQVALGRGRAYSNLTRNKKGDPLFDEVAIMNDINAACAAVTSRAHTSQVSSSDTVEERLERLAALRKSGLIDEADFARRKAGILDSV